MVDRSSAGRRVLACDDELKILRALKLVLRPEGYEVLTAASIEEALDVVALSAVDAAIVDLVLPDGNGIDLCRRLREWSSMPIIVLSAVGQQEEKVRALRAGADDYVTKPFDPQELVARLEAVLRRVAPEPEERVVAAAGLEVDLAAAQASDRVRENAFNLIGPVDDADVLDLFAGSGALGIEALSRGASTATFVELDRYACKVISANLDSLDFRGTVVQQDAVRAVTSERRTYDLILCDPPYGYDHGKVTLHLARLLKEDGVLVYESSGREDPPEVPGLEQRTSRKYGSARLTLFDK